MAKRTGKREGALWPALREYWHPVAFADELKDDKPLAVTLLDERLAICRLGGKPRAFYDLCIHRGTPISLGWVEGESIVC
ncbi:MAG: Rieske (2Fe-2S) protein, partial [Nitrospinota bacterium]|nr:Rieske (2Fe-2S) protein [Nitrospinota bacterium]